MLTVVVASTILRETNHLPPPPKTTVSSGYKYPECVFRTLREVPFPPLSPCLDGCCSYPLSFPLCQAVTCCRRTIPPTPCFQSLLHGFCPHMLTIVIRLCLLAHNLHYRGHVYFRHSCQHTYACPARICQQNPLPLTQAGKTGCLLI